MKVLCINSNGLKNDGITNSIISYYSYMNRDDLSIDILKVRDINPKIEQKFKSIGLKIKFTDYRKNVFSYIIKTAILIRNEKYDIVHVHGSSAILSIDLLAAWIGGCKIRIAHSRNTKCNYKKIDKLVRPIFYMLCTSRFACGEDAGKWLFGNRTYTVIKNGKDLNKFKFNSQIRQKIRNNYGLENKIVVGHVGNFNFQKNHEFLINIFSELKIKNKKYYLILIGTGEEYLKRAKIQVKKLGIAESVLFMGSIDNVDNMLQAMDIMLLPSHYEGLPNVVLEWQIAGLPSVISDDITKECKITDLVTFLSINKGVDLWVKTVETINVSDDRINSSINACKEMQNVGYDIIENAKFLKREYYQLIGRCDDEFK